MKRQKMILISLGIASLATGTASFVHWSSGQSQSSFHSKAFRGEKAPHSQTGDASFGQPPQGPPPDGMGEGPGGPGGPGGPPPGGGGDSNYTLLGAYVVGSGQNLAQSDKEYNSNQKDTSAIWVKNGGKLALSNAKITTSGNTSSNDASSFHGLNAAVLVTTNSYVKVINSSIKTTGTGANGLFAAGQNAKAEMVGGSIHASNDGGHGVMATKGGTVLLKNVDIVTEKSRAGAVATDRGGGIIEVKSGSVTTYGFRSPGIYSTGKICAEGASFNAVGAEAAVIEGQNTIDLIDCDLKASKSWGVMIYQSFSGDAQGRKGTFTMKGGALNAKVGPLFFVTNAEAVINLSGVVLNAESGVLIDASANQWGNKGNNGGIANVFASDQILKGDITTDSISLVRLDLKNRSIYTGKASRTTLTLDATSKWIVTGESSLQKLGEGTPIANIQGNGHNVTYDATLKSNQWLKGQRYALSGGGELKPK